MSRIAYLLSLAVVFSIAFENSVDVPGLGTAPRVLGLALAAAWLLSRVGKRHPVRLEAFHVILLAFVAWNALTILWSVDAPGAVAKATTYVQLLVFTVILWDLYRTAERILSGLQAYVLGCYVTLFGALFELASGSGEGYYQRAAAAGFDSNFMAVLLALGIPTAWYLIITRWSRDKSVALFALNIAYVPAAVVVILLSGSRGGLITATIGGVYVAAAAFRLSVSMRLLTVALVVVLGVLANSSLLQLQEQRLEQATSGGAVGDLNGRLPIWREGAHVMVESPANLIVGVGAAAYAEVNSLGKGAHNTLVSVAVETGLVGLGLFLSLWAIALSVSLRQRAPAKAYWTTAVLMLLVGGSSLTYETEKTWWLFISMAIISARCAVRTSQEIGVHEVGDRRVQLPVVATDPGRPVPVAAYRYLARPTS